MSHARPYQLVRIILGYIADVYRNLEFEDERPNYQSDDIRIQQEVFSEVEAALHEILTEYKGKLVIEIDHGFPNMKLHMIVQTSVSDN